MNEHGKNWNSVYKNEYNINGVTFPSEYIIRIFKGKYPDCNLKEYMGGFAEKRVLDISCGGVGRDLIVLKQVGFENICATEITEEIVNEVIENSSRIGLSVDARVGNNRQLPFEDNWFDCIISWNVCYYFDEVIDFSLHVKEYARVCKPGATMVFSIPKRNCFIYRDCVDRGNGLVEITNDPFEIRNGVLLYRFDNEESIVREFGDYFEDFHFGSIEDNCFGLNYSWHIGYCRRRRG